MTWDGTVAVWDVDFMSRNETLSVPLVAGFSASKLSCLILSPRWSTVMMTLWCQVSDACDLREIKCVNWVG